MAIIKVKTGGITADAVTDALIADDVVGTEHLTANEVDTAALKADAVTGAQLADDAVNSEHYTDGSIDTAHIADNQVTLAKLAGGTDGNIISFDASGDPVAIATGNDGQVLTSTGAGSPPAFEALPGGGKVLQVKTVTDGTNRSTTSQTFGLNSSTLTLDITPSATSSKILILCSVMLYIAASAGRLTIFRDSTNLAEGIASGTEDSFITTDGSNKYLATSGLNFLDSPSSTSAVNYQIRFRNNQANTTTSLPFSSAIGVLTLIEIGA